MDTTQPSPLAVSLTRVRLVILALTGMGCLTWQGMCGSGVGIGMGRIRVARSPTRVVPHQARTVCIGAAVGTTVRKTAGRRFAGTTATRRAATATSGSAPSCPQVSHEQGSESGAGVAERVERGTPACGASMKMVNVCDWKKRSPRSGRDFWWSADILVGPVGGTSVREKADKNVGAPMRVRD